ncbi:coiled-coil domain-containing protein 103-like [Plakobranchus ocellatus]|uniref:Coiled-coil domain-containing protein 103-like n=1 Tax=Plakobranchus ocellatus TaxID=259542 RepID=A0AAV4A2T1_9GAST|nr:coiled-coil domain-containing protein 103-like [Plakobranchus ocellatus]
MTTTKSSHDDDSLDFGKVEREAKSMVDYDERYWLENSAKFRAVEQRVASYDEFREIVMAAHLKPLEKEDKISSMGVFTQVWNQSALKNPQKDGNYSNGNPDTSDMTNHSTVKVPKTGQEFLQHWKRECKTLEQKRHFIMAIGSVKIQELFQIEINGGLLGEFVDCLLHDFDESETKCVIELLESLSKSQRFSLALAFLSKKEKENLAALFEELCKLQHSQESIELKERVAVLKTLYRV